MDAANNSAESLRQQIKATEEQLNTLKAQLQEIEPRAASENNTSHDSPQPSSKWPLSPEEYKRYGRQMIVPNIGIQGQLHLKSASVLIVGAGGLGCPAAAYLAGAGVGTLGLVDGDVVETSNLHRQILHSMGKVGMKKVDSAIEYLKSLNPNIKYRAHDSHLTSQTASSIVKNYDLIIDCTDHPTSRYLISDACVLFSKPLVSASALRTDGQLLLLNHPPLPPGSIGGGPCYRCVFPKPPPVESVVSCGDGGILGPVVGVMGVLQALEAIKLITSGKLPLSTSPSTSSTDFSNKEPETPTGATMLLFSSTTTPPFRSLRLRSTRRPNCFACSGSPDGLTLESLTSGSMDYIQFCGVTTPVNLLSPSERISPTTYANTLSKSPHILLDVREKIQFDICSLPGSINVPFSTLQQSLTGEGEQPEWLKGHVPEDAPIYVVCRLGNDSQVIARRFKELGVGGGRWIGDLRDGLKGWRKEIDESWPEY